MSWGCRHVKRASITAARWKPAVIQSILRRAADLQATAVPERCAIPIPARQIRREEQEKRRGSGGKPRPAVPSSPRRAALRDARILAVDAREAFYVAAEWLTQDPRMAHRVTCAIAHCITGALRQVGGSRAGGRA